LLTLPRSANVETPRAGAEGKENLCIERIVCEEHVNQALDTQLGLANILTQQRLCSLLVDPF